METKVVRMGDKDLGVAVSAVRTLETLKDPRALPRLGVLAASPSPKLRAAVAHALPVLGGLPAHAEAFGS